MSNWSHKGLPSVDSEQDYKAIVAWNKKLGSYDYYIQEQIKAARATKAPFDAIYRRESGAWARIADIKNLESRHDMKVFLDLQEQLS